MTSQRITRATPKSASGWHPATTRSPTPCTRSATPTLRSSHSRRLATFSRRWSTTTRPSPNFAVSSPTVMPSSRLCCGIPAARPGARTLREGTEAARGARRGESLGARSPKRSGAVLQSAWQRLLGDRQAGRGSRLVRESVCPAKGLGRRQSVAGRLRVRSGRHPRKHRCFEAIQQNSSPPRPPSSARESSSSSSSAFPTPDDYYNLACYHSRLAGLAREPGAEITALAARIEADLAMKDLVSAVAAGFHIRSLLANDRDLDSIRSRSDFQLLILDLTFPEDPFAR